MGHNPEQLGHTQGRACDDTGRRWFSTNQVKRPPETGPASVFIWNAQPPGKAVSLTLCYSGLSKIYEHLV